MTSVPFKAFALGATLGLVIAVAPSCGSSALACDATTCAAGCCANGICLAGTAVNACGKGGKACNSCSAGQSCTAGSCGSTFTGGGQGGGSGGGGGTMTVTCTMTQCKKDNMCFPGTAADSCGSGGTACTVCTASQECNQNACVAKVVDSGVVDSGVVDSGTPVADAGANCSPTTCPAGCCLNNMCQNGDQNSACGANGIVCAVCTGQVCDHNACTSTMPVDAGTDAGTVDSGVDPVDSGTVDSGTVDSGTVDSGMPEVDAGTPCAPSVVISQLFPAGGNNMAIVNADYVELHNRTNAAVDVSGMSLQYNSATSVAQIWNVYPLQGSIPANGFLLVRTGNITSDAGAVPMPHITSPDAGFLSMGATAGKIVLATGSVPVTGQCPTTNVIDWVGYGATANCAEGGTSGMAAPAPSTTTAIFRKTAALACTDTNSNSADFEAAAPAPRTSASAAAVCTCQ